MIIRTALIAIVALTVLTLTGKAETKIDDLPNSCFLLATKTQEIMGYGEVLSVFGTVQVKGETKRMGHSVFVYSKGNFTVVYDRQGSRQLPALNVPYPDLAKLVALDAFKQVPPDLQWNVVKYFKK